MTYHGLVKQLDLPARWRAPAELAYDDIRARAISRADNDDDVQGINASIELIRRTRGSRWPTEPVSVDFNYVDEVWHECEFRDGRSFTYGVYDSSGRPASRFRSAAAAPAPAVAAVVISGMLYSVALGEAFPL